MRTTPTESTTRDRLLDAAQALMLSKGYTATSVEEICTAAGLTKGSFFHHFEGKEHLGRVVAERFSASMRQVFESAPFHQEKEPLDRVYGRVDFVIEMIRCGQGPKGCLLGTFVQELSATHPGIRDVCAACLAEGSLSFQKDLDEAKARHAPDAPWTGQSLAEHFTAVVQGAMILAKAKQDPAVMGESLTHFRDYLRFLFGR
jgi:TetR/AcrR family transcriptional repressor of nem operon